MSNNTSLIYERPTDVTTTPEFFFGYLSSASGGLWGYAIMFMVFGISFLSLQNYNSLRAFAASSYITLGATILLIPFNIVGTYHLTLAGIMVILALVVNSDSRGVI